MLHPVLQLHLTETNVPCSGSAGNNALFFFFSKPLYFSKLLVVPVRQGRRGGESFPADIGWE